MKNDRLVNDFAEDGADVYPHLKLTDELFPRVLATRRIEDDGAEYFGAFLTKTSVRILIDFLNRTFRLRSCDISIDGSFPMPCTQYYRKRCLAPCVASLCSPVEYRERVSLVKLFLNDQRGSLIAAIRKKMELSSEDLDFEQAAHWRDMQAAIDEYWNNPRLRVWLDDTVDTYDADETAAGSFIYLVSQRGKNVIGRKVFRLPRGGGLPPHEALERIIGSFYRFHLPREIRVSMDFEGRHKLASELSDRFGRPAKIVLTRPDRQRITAIRALQSAWFENELEFVKTKATARQISGELKRSFGLVELPSRVEAFDVAHISGMYFVAASAVWEQGEFLPEQHRFYISSETSEPAAMADAVRLRLADEQASRPGLILLDGGRAQVNATHKLLSAAGTAVNVIGAVKPAAKHSALSHYVSTAGGRFDYEIDNPAHNMLRLLRDAAHDLANRVHRDLREMGHYYELAEMLPSLTEVERRRVIASAGSVAKLRAADDAALSSLIGSELSPRTIADLARHHSAVPANVLPLIVPIRFIAEDGDAEDLIPIDSR